MIKDEIKTVIVLSGSKRLPDLEVEIFADEELATLYLHNLCKEEDWYDGYENNTCLAFFYAVYTLGTRWPVAEVLISPKYSWHWYRRYKEVYAISD